uniref:hypothetical protein n=1 Tax=Mediterraneibacter faecis TaxID=592978 RepID=UPI003AADCE9C
MQDGVIFWNQSKVQSDDQNRENPENIPGLSKIFIFYHFFDGMGGWIPYEKDEKNAEKIIQDSKSRKIGKCKVFRTKIQHCRSSSGKAVKARKNCTDGKIDADRFPK